MAQNYAEEPWPQIQVERVVDPNSPDLHEALKLYDLRIPEHERFQAPDIVRWIREDQEQTERGELRPRDFFLVAKSHHHVCGFVLFHYYPTAKYAFIAYLVAVKDQTDSDGSREGISRRLLAEVRRLLDGSGPIKDCEGILLEVDRPPNAETEEEWKMRLSRIRLFYMLAAGEGFPLRAFDLDYRQPPLSVDEPDANVPLVLMYADPRNRQSASYVSSVVVRRILRFIYTELYPEGYSDNNLENRAYKACLRKLCGERSREISKKVRMLDYRQLRANMKKPEYPQKLAAPDNSGFSVFISYAHADNEGTDRSRRWLDRLVECLQPLVMQKQVRAWSDLEIETGENWQESIQAEIKNANVAVLLVSSSFLASKYISNNELPILLMKANKEMGLTVLPIVVRHCLFSESKFSYTNPVSGRTEEIPLSIFQSANPPDKPLNSMQEHEQDKVLVSIAQRIKKLAEEYSGSRV